MFKRLLLSIMLIVVLFSSGCSFDRTVENKAGGQQPPSKVAVKIATINGPSAMSMVKMIAEKPSLGENVEAEYIIKDNPELIKAMILNKEVDIATIPATLASILYNKQGEYQAAAITVWGTLYLVGEDTAIDGWAGLRNKKIYMMGKGLTPDVVFRYLMKEKGIDPGKDIELDYSFPMPADLANAVSAGEAKLAVLSEPMASMALAKNKKLKVIMDLNQEWDQAVSTIPMAQTCVVVKKEFAAAHPDITEAYLEAYRQSADWVNANPEPAGELIASSQILPNPKIAAASIPRSNIRYEDAFKIKDGINAYLKLFYDFDPKIVGGKLPDEGFYYKR